ncbi:GntR family transcriptional regulator YhfZ [Photorhabdus tasmaniensis]|uniref:GntR family transcriptional regulator YhfZ n=1 Tax=Photorhabdus tasmaniensis TaxID=1004159 RepID=UPI0040436D10
MSRGLLKKEGVAQACLARYLLGECNGNRLKTIEELSSDYALSVGLVQLALKKLENSGAICVDRRGRNGSYLVSLDHKALLAHADIGNVVCVMPLPYTRLYEGLASGLKAQFDGIPFYFAHMRGSDARVECLRNGIYDLAVVSHLAAQTYLEQRDVCAVLGLGPHTYVGAHQLIYRKGGEQNIRRVGLDHHSADQKIMTEVYFAGQDITLVSISYHESLDKVAKGDIDAVIWNVSREYELSSRELIAVPLHGNPLFIQASEAVILTRVDDIPIQQLLRTTVNKTELLAHQQRVLTGQQDPSY